MNNEVILISEFAKRAGGEALKAVDWNILHKYAGTNIRDVISHINGLINAGSPVPNTYILDNQEEVSYETLESYERAHSALRLHITIEKLEPLFLKFPSALELLSTMQGRKHLDKTEAMNDGIRNFPYKITMLYFATRYITLESDQHKYNSFMNMMDEALDQFGIKPHSLLASAEDSHALVSKWEGLEGAVINQLESEGIHIRKGLY